MEKKRRSPTRRSIHESLDEFRTSLGPTAAQYTDLQLRQLQTEMKAMADILLDLYAEGVNNRREADGNVIRLTSCTLPNRI
jgi:hypothetical protein